MLKSRPIGLLAHQASIDSRGRHIFDLLADEGMNIAALFGPEHGLDSSAQDMEAVPYARHRVNPNSRVRNPGQISNLKSRALNIPIYSLYGKTSDSLRPTNEMFEGIDYLIVDLQDIGARYYTYIYTLAFCMQTAAETGTNVVVCDRPNPINGIDVEGPLIEKGFESFVGMYPIPNRHGMTIGELAGYFNREFNIGCDLEIVAMEGWNRNWHWDETGLNWINPSPNMRSVSAALLYPGMCLIEGTNVSEGRGTETPFEHCGAPFIDSGDLTKKLTSFKLPGINFHPASFIPARQKWENERCHGARFEITGRKLFKPCLAGLALLHTLASYEGFKWRTEEYEFRSDVPAIDLLTGSARARELIDKRGPFTTLKKTLTKTPKRFLKTRRKYLLYP